MRYPYRDAQHGAQAGRSLSHPPLSSTLGVSGVTLDFRAISGGLALCIALLVVQALVPTASPVAMWLPYLSVLFGAALTGYLLKARLFTHLTVLSS